jgi:hypothetical protein
MNWQLFLLISVIYGVNDRPVGVIMFALFSFAALVAGK